MKQIHSSCRLTYILMVAVIFLLIIACNNSQYFEAGLKQVNGMELYYKIHGSGEPIVIIHGRPMMEHTYLLPQMNMLTELLQLIYYDQRNSRRSIAGTDSNSVTLDNYIEDLEGFRISMGLEEMNLLGHS